MTPKETDPDVSVSVQKSLVEVWAGGGLLQGWGQCLQGAPFEGGEILNTIIFITSTIV